VGGEGFEELPGQVRRRAHRRQSGGVDLGDIAFGRRQNEHAARDPLGRQVDARQAITFIGEQLGDPVARIADHTEVAVMPDQVGDGGVDLLGAQHRRALDHHPAERDAQALAGKGTIARWGWGWRRRRRGGRGHG